jgi:hypothetical protein
MAHGLGRRPAPDERDKRFPMTAALVAIPARPSRKTWRVWWKGDQGASPHCVGYSWYAMLRSLPLLQREPQADYIYHEAQKVDEWDGEGYAGTSVRAGAKILQREGKLLSYGWGYDLETVLQWLAFKGPVVLGTTWHDDMFTPNPAGIVSRTGASVGGHAYIALGYDDKAGLLYCQNSWGTDWGVKGRFYLRYADADRLIRDDGEACTALE